MHDQGACQINLQQSCAVQFHQCCFQDHIKECTRCLETYTVNLYQGHTLWPCPCVQVCGGPWFQQTKQLQPTHWHGIPSHYSCEQSQRKPKSRTVWPHLCRCVYVCVCVFVCAHTHYCVDVDQFYECACMPVSNCVRPSKKVCEVLCMVASCEVLDW